MDFVVLQKISYVSSRSLNKNEIHVLKITSKEKCMVSELNLGHEQGVALFQLLIPFCTKEKGGRHCLETRSMLQTSTT
jgi:hypothetical protein